MSPLGVIPDFITSFHPNPLRNGAVLFLFFGQEPLDSEGLVRRLKPSPPSPLNLTTSLEAGSTAQKPVLTRRAGI